MKDSYSNQIHKTSMIAAAYTVAADGTTVDITGYSGVQAVLEVGTQAGTSVTFVLHESDDDSTWNAVASGDIYGDTTTNSFVITTANDATVYRIGYKGVKRYLRWEITAATAGNLPATAYILCGYPRHAPAS